MTVSKTKFYHAVAVLPEEVVAQLLDLIRTPPAVILYEVLRERLITLYSLNNFQRFKALVSLPLTGGSEDFSPDELDACTPSSLQTGLHPARFVSPPSTF